MSKNDMEIRVLLHDIRSAHNVGSVFRTSDAIGVSKIYLTGITPLPVDKFKRPRKEIAKTALGAEETIVWEYAANPLTFIDAAKNEGFSVIGLEQNENSYDYRTYTPPTKTLFVVGSEVEGMSAELLKACNAIVEIPMYGRKESLNVAVAFGVAVFRLFDKEKPRSQAG